MEERIKKTFFKKIVYNRIFITLSGLIIIMVISLPLIKNFIKRHETNKEIRQLQNEITNLENKNSQIKKLIEYFQSDSYIEEQAKLNLNMRKEGEEVAVIKNTKEAENNSITPGAQDSLIANSPAASGTKKNFNPLVWLNYFFLK